AVCLESRYKYRQTKWGLPAPWHCTVRHGDVRKSYIAYIAVPGAAADRRVGEERVGEEKESQVGTKPAGAGPRDATRGGVNGPACRPRGDGNVPYRQRGRERPLSIERHAADRGVQDLDRVGGAEALALVPEQHLDLQRAAGVGADQELGGGGEHALDLAL